MKTKYYFLILGLTTIFFKLNAQISNKEALIKTWFVDAESSKAAFNNQNGYLTADEFIHMLFILSDYESTYFSNNTFSYTLMGAKTNGTWQIKNSVLILNTDESVSEYEIISLNDNSMVVKDTSGLTFCYSTDKDKSKLKSKDIFHRVDE